MTSVFAIKIPKTQGVDRAFISSALSVWNVAYFDLQLFLEVLSSLSDPNRAGIFHSEQLLSHELDEWRIGTGVWQKQRFMWSTQCPERLLNLTDLCYTAFRAAIDPARPGLRSV